MSEQKIHFGERYCPIKEKQCKHFMPDDSGDCHMEDACRISMLEALVKSLRAQVEGMKRQRIMLAASEVCIDRLREQLCKDDCLECDYCFELCKRQEEG